MPTTWSAEVVVLTRYWRRSQGLHVHGSHAGVAASKAIQIYLRTLPKGTRIAEIRLTLRRLSNVPAKPPAEP